MLPKLYSPKMASHVTPLLLVARECAAITSTRSCLQSAITRPLSSIASMKHHHHHHHSFFSTSTSTSTTPPSSSLGHPPRRPANSLSRSRFSEKRGKIHGAPFKTVKGNLSPPRIVPQFLPSGDPFPLAPYAPGGGGSVPTSYPEPTIHDTEVKRDKMRKASAIAAQVLARAGELVKPGVTTDELDAAVHAHTIALGAYPSPLSYMGFPKSVCSSINEVVCHGIPDDTVIQEGDIVKLDVSCFVGGVHGDTCRTFVATTGSGTNASVAFDLIDKEGARLIHTTKAALHLAIGICGPGVPIQKIGATIGQYLEKQRYEGVDAFAGHGISGSFHTEPIVHHHPNKSSYIMKPGMTFTIEPMVVEGSNRVMMWEDGWTVVTEDAGRAAQFEHTLLITENGVEVLTRYE